jgi:hypothetical protein
MFVHLRARLLFVCSLNLLSYTIVFLVALVTIPTVYQTPVLTS